MKFFFPASLRKDRFNHWYSIESDAKYRSQHETISQLKQIAPLDDILCTRAIPIRVKCPINYPIYQSYPVPSPIAIQPMFIPHQPTIPDPDPPIWDNSIQPVTQTVTEKIRPSADSQFIETTTPRFEAPFPTRAANIPTYRPSPKPIWLDTTCPPPSDSSTEQKYGNVLLNYFTQFGNQIKEKAKMRKAQRSLKSPIYETYKKQCYRFRYVRRRLCSSEGGALPAQPAFQASVPAVSQPIFSQQILTQPIADPAFVFTMQHQPLFLQQAPFSNNGGFNQHFQMPQIN